ncbi:MAG: DUF3604 domain-containing protein [Candidatus Lokiarchaeota archaeon]|nr:DUF3604 domain-containing protein [Candidatus Lokiarchaeota archaeon]MBD3200370.1 DUF3604 domain-containing protein [Candidatus Lokiarchaeota archaeon]
MNEPIAIEEKYGQIDLDSSENYIAGTYSTLKLTYTAGIYGMDDLGGLKILFRYACDQSPLQFDSALDVGYTTASASNGARIELSYALREGKRPWYKVLRVRIAGSGLKKGERIKIILGNTKFGSPGLRLQTFVEPKFEIRTMVDVFSTNVFLPIESPYISIIPGRPLKWQAVVPTLRSNKETFSLKIRAEDKWGNPTNQIRGKFFLTANTEIKGLPAWFNWISESYSHIIPNLSARDIGNEQSSIRISLKNSKGEILVTSNPLILKKTLDFLHFWGDIHGQSGETIGTNTIKEYYEFAKNRAFLDVSSHQGNDFQITNQLWKRINRISNEFNNPEDFITLCGYEYSANTALGGDRNVYFIDSERKIYRSSHALINDKSDLDSDCLTADDLFQTLVHKNQDYDKSVIVIAHVGGRYADILGFHDGRIEHSIEIHSAWGTFEWLLKEAFKKNYRIGIVANGDDHKGRPGIAYPGASKFGALGGLTCFLAKNFSREAIFEALKRRHHYATTGERIYIEVVGKLNCSGELFRRDPAVFSLENNITENTNEIIMGDIIRVSEVKNHPTITLEVTIEGHSPIERIELFNGMVLLETIKPFLINELGEIESVKNYKKIRVLWEGAEFKARRRNVQWMGTAEFRGNIIQKVSSFNFWNLDNPLVKESPNKVSWNTMTSGNFQGFDVILQDGMKGSFDFKSNQVEFTIPISEIGLEDKIIEIGGIDKKVRIFRIPIFNRIRSYHFSRKLELNPNTKKDEQIWIRATFENGHQAWSSPIYIISN